MKDTFAALVRDSSTRSFSLRTTAADAAILAVLGASAGCAAFFLGRETGFAWRALAALQAAVAARSCFAVLRSLVPMALLLSFADMMRLRTAFYVWTVCLVGLVALGPVTRAVFSAFSAASAGLALTLASVALTVRFLRSGSPTALALASACAGLTLGVSAFGFVAAAVSLAVLKVAAVRLLRDDGSPWKDSLDPRMVDYFADPLVRTRVNWVLALCFFACAALSFCAVRADVAPAVAARLRVPWGYGVSIDGAALLLVTGVLPFVAAVGKARRASDTFERLGLCLTVLYLAIAAVSSVMLLNPALVVIVSGATLRVETGLIVLSCVLYAYNVLLSTTCLLVDVRCGRRPDDDGGERALSLRGAVRALYALACLVPLALFALVAANLVAHLLFFS